MSVHIFFLLLNGWGQLQNMNYECDLKRFHTFPPWKVTCESLFQSRYFSVHSVKQSPSYHHRKTVWAECESSHALQSFTSSSSAYHWPIRGPFRDPHRWKSKGAMARLYTGWPKLSNFTSNNISLVWVAVWGLSTVKHDENILDELNPQWYFVMIQSPLLFLRIMSDIRLPRTFCRQLEVWIIFNHPHMCKWYAPSMKGTWVYHCQLVT
jgi:hypothetical protein